MSYTEEQGIKILDQAPECDKHCSWCLNTDEWKCINFIETDYGTTIYEYECTHVDDLDEGIICASVTSQEIDDENPAI